MFAQHHSALLSYCSALPCRIPKPAQRGLLLSALAGPPQGAFQTFFFSIPGPLSPLHPPLFAVCPSSSCLWPRQQQRRSLHFDSQTRSPHILGRHRASPPPISRCSFRVTPYSSPQFSIMANPSTPVKVPPSAANYTAATLDPDLRSQINSILIKEGHVTRQARPGPVLCLLHLVYAAEWPLC